MINHKTIKVGEFVRKFQPPHDQYTVVEVYANSEWFILKPHLDSNLEADLNRISIDAYTLARDYELAGKPECDLSIKPKVGINPENVKVGDYLKYAEGPSFSYRVTGTVGTGLQLSTGPHFSDKWDIHVPWGTKWLRDLVVDDNPKKSVQNPSPYRFDLLPAEAMLKIAECMAKGDIEHGRDNWKKIEASVHHGRAMGHMFEAKASDQSTREREDHYTHTALRAIFALQMAIEEGKVK